MALKFHQCKVNANNQVYCMCIYFSTKTISVVNSPISMSSWIFIFLVAENLDFASPSECVRNVITCNSHCTSSGEKARWKILPKSDLSILFSVILSWMDINSELWKNDSKPVSCNYGHKFKIKL